ncbi:dCTP deaminase [Candidatus Parcubacteria bacterium]|nr:MAG: dCTP deaminase [Candidatus Parcubacteria bacterium]
MILSDRDLKAAIRSGRLKFSPELLPAQIGPASIDLRLSTDFKVFKTSYVALLDPKEGFPGDIMLDARRVPATKPFILHPGDFVLASTMERITVPDDMVVRVEGKSTLARMGILVHTAGFVDPGFSGNITLEISNQSNVAIALYPGMYICQVAAHRLSSPAEVPYNRRKRSAYRTANAKGTVVASPKNLFPK